MCDYDLTSTTNTCDTHFQSTTDNMKYTVHGSTILFCKKSTYFVEQFVKPVCNQDV